MPNSCSMKDCPSNARYDKLRSFHGFPHDTERCKAWVEACGRPELLQLSLEYLSKNSHICDLHFKPSDRKLKKLKAHAMPVPHDQVPMESKCTQTDNALNETSDSDTDIENNPGSSTAAKTTGKNKGKRNRKKSDLKILLGKLRSLHDAKCGLKSELFTLIDVQNELNKISNDKKCVEKFLAYALNLYLACPNTYRIIRLSLTLPTEQALRKTKLEIDAVIGYNLILNLKSKMGTLDPKDKYCTVCLKKMSLKRFLFYHITKDKVIGFRNINGKETMDPATEVYVLMARGLKAKWEQPLAYCFLDEDDDSSNINSWLESVLNVLIDVGCEVVALVVDHQDLYEYFRIRIQSVTQPYILLNNNKKIYCIFDLPQLILSLRNTLMTHELQFQDDDGSLVIADWKTIEDLYLGNASKLTESHINPNESEKRELKYATQVFSKSVSDALDMESKKRLEQDIRIKGTRKLTALVNDVFDILNSSAINHHNKCKNAFTGEPHQMRAIRLFMEFLTNVKPLNALDVEDTSFNCIYGLRISIMSFSVILRDLLPKGIKALVTHRFNLDAINRFFNLVKLKSGTEKPTAVQFFKCFRKTFMIELMKHPKTVRQSDNLLHFLNRIDFKLLTRGKLKSDDFRKTIEVGTVDYRFELPTKDSFHYICWYLLKKCVEMHEEGACDQLHRYLQDHVQDVDWKVYAWDSYFLPPKVFINYIKILDEQTSQNFGHKFEIGLGTGILLILKDIRFELMCPCFPINYLRRLFVRLRIFNIIRYNNRRLSDDSFRFSKTDHYNIDIL